VQAFYFIYSLTLIRPLHDIVIEVIPVRCSCKLGAWKLRQRMEIQPIYCQQKGIDDSSYRNEEQRSRNRKIIYSHFGDKFLESKFLEGMRNLCGFEVGIKQ
jgi:hypothetical protein